MSEPVPPGPEQMRALVADYVRAVHETYLRHTLHLPPGERAALPLSRAGQLHVAAAAARQLHLLATTQALPDEQHSSVEGDLPGLSWRLHFFDASVQPELGLGEDTPAAVRRILGIEDVIYHLTVAAGGSLTEHHAAHSAVALANQHTDLSRGLIRLRQALPRQADLVDEFGTCLRLGLDHAAVALAGQLTAGRATPRGAADALAVVLREVAQP